jgi:hypothetical protein
LDYSPDGHIDANNGDLESTLDGTGKAGIMAQPITKDLLERIDSEFTAAATPDEVRAVFKRYYTDLGWKRLCRLFVLQYGVDELWAGEEERVAKGGSRRDD